MTETPFDTRSSWHATTAVIDVSGEIDMTTAPALARAVESVRGVAERVVIDLSQVEFLDSSGLSTLVRCRRELAETGATLAVVSPANHGSRRVIEIARLGESLGVVSTLAEALDRSEAPD